MLQTGTAEAMNASQQRSLDFSTPLTFGALNTITQQLSQQIATQFQALQESHCRQFEEFCARQETRVEERLNDLTAINQRLESNEQSITNHDMRICQLEESASTLAKNQHANMPPETSELIISGIPMDLNIEPKQLAMHVMRALELTHLQDDILTCALFPRERMLRASHSLSTLRSVVPEGGPPTAQTSNDGRCTDSSSSMLDNVVDGLSTDNTRFKRIVVRFKSTHTRDFVISTRLGFRVFTANTVFGHTSSSSINLQTVYPKQLYSMLRLARTKSRELGYRNPRVIDMVVHMCKDTKTPLIPIYHSSDFLKLLPNTPNPQ